MIAALISLAGLLLSAITFLLGKTFSESEKVLTDKRRIYEEFLRQCPVPSEAYDQLSEAEVRERGLRFGRLMPVVALYASPAVSLAIGQYVAAFGEAEQALSPSSVALHPAFKKAAKAHNDVILEMNRDAFAWSLFGYRGPSRLPKDALDQARRNSL